MTTHAQTAAMIRKELRHAFPTTKFSVTCDSFAMGSSVDIRYTDSIPSQEVEKIVNKYEYGHFDSMTDMYEYSNDRKDIPQVKYVIVQRRLSNEARTAKKLEIAKLYGIEDVTNEGEWMEKTLRRSGEMVLRSLENQTI